MTVRTRIARPTRGIKDYFRKEKACRLARPSCLCLHLVYNKLLVELAVPAAAGVACTTR